MAGSITCSGDVKKKLAHVVVFPFPAQGHINPMMHLSKQLALQGIIVTFIHTEFNYNRWLRSQAAMGSDGQSEEEQVQKLGIRVVAISDGLGHDEYSNFDQRKLCQAMLDIEPALEKLVGELQPPVTCILGDMFIISTSPVAHRLGIPHVAFYTQCAASYAAHLLFSIDQASLKDKVVPVKGLEAERHVTWIPGCPALSYEEVPDFLKICDPNEFLFQLVLKCWSHVPTSKYLLMNTFQDLEPESLAFIRERTPHMLAIGPILPAEFVMRPDTAEDEAKQSKIKLGTSMWVEDHGGCLPWLDQQKPRSVLYVSFGSVAMMSVRQLEEFAAGLEASGCLFLMVVRPQLMVEGSPAAFLEEFAERMQGSGRAAVVAWAPQLEVLCHQAIGGFLTHCGWNSTLEALSRGVPMLCWPYFADQMLDCRCIVDAWNIGLDFVPDRSHHTTNPNDRFPLVPRSEIQQKIRQLMDPSTSGSIRDSAHKIHLAAKKAFMGSSRDDLNKLLEFLQGA